MRGSRPLAELGARSPTGRRRASASCTTPRPRSTRAQLGPAAGAPSSCRARSSLCSPRTPAGGLLAGRGEPIWSDEWCRVWEVEVDSRRPSDRHERKRRRDDGRAGRNRGGIAGRAAARGAARRLRRRAASRARCSTPRRVDVLGWALGAERRAVAVEFSDRRRGRSGGRRCGPSGRTWPRPSRSAPRRRGRASARR